MLVTHAINKAAQADPQDLRVFCFLADFGGWLTFAAAMATTLILSETSIDYLRFMFGQRPRLWVVAAIVIGSAVVIAVDFVLVLRGTRALRRSITNTEEDTHLALRSVQVATICTGVLAVVASWLGISLARFPREWLAEPSAAFVAVVLFLMFGLPTVISTAICFSVASTDARQAPSSE